MGAALGIVTLAGLTACSAGGVDEHYESQTTFSYAPANMQSGGVVFTSPDSVFPSPALDASAPRMASDVGTVDAPVHLSVYVDYMCPACGSFEQTFGELITERLEAGEISLEVTPLTFLNRSSQGTDYSSRAANALGCTVDQQPAAALGLHERLLSWQVQPKQATSGLSNAELIEQAEQAGVDVDEAFVDCVMSGAYMTFFDTNSEDIMNGGGVVGLADGEFLLDPEGNPQTGPQRVNGTPFVIINGAQWDYTADPDLGAALNTAAAAQ